MVPPGLVSDDGDITDTPGLVSDDSDITDTSDDEEEIDRSKEVDPRTVAFHFLRTGSSIINFSLLIIHDYEGKSKKEGVLITHNMFKFQKNNASRDYSTWWYTCSHSMGAVPGPSSRGGSSWARMGSTWSRMSWWKLLHLRLMFQIVSL